MYESDSINPLALMSPVTVNFVVGLGRSGFWAAKFLKSLGKKVVVWENKENKELLEKKEALEKN